MEIINLIMKRKKHFIITLQIFIFAGMAFAQEVSIFPTPQKVTLNATKEFLLDSTAKIVMPANATQRDLNTAEELSGNIYAQTKFKIPVVKSENHFQQRNTIYIGQPSEDLRFAELLKSQELTPPVSKEGYVLHIGEKQIIIAGYDAAGTYYGIQTLRQLFHKKGTALQIPAVNVADAPDMKYRGLFIENKWGSDLMTLHDYQNLINEMAQLKFNSLAVGVYGCWNVQYRNTITEFMLLPFRQFPELNTPKLIEFYSPGKASWQSVDYLPAMYQQDFFGKLIEYGQKHFITVRPKFNSIGHNTLIPRLHPEVSAVDSNGTPIGEGFCTSKEETYTLLFSIFDEIINRYLKPNNITSFDIQMDEVYRWCECPKCRILPQEERYIRHLLRLATHLRDKGIQNIGVWADMLESRHMLTNELVKRFNDAGLTDHIMLQWWHYSRKPYTSTKPELGLRTCVVPMTGYLYLYHYSYGLPRVTNVYEMLSLGYTGHAEGTESYCIYDPAYHRSTAALAEWAWRCPISLDEDQALAQYRDKYAQTFFPKYQHEAVSVFETLDDVYLNYGQGLLGSILYYNYSYVRTVPYKKRPYPQEAYQTLEKNPAQWDRLSTAAASLNRAKIFFLKVALGDPENQLAWQQLANVTYSANLSQNFLILKEMEQKYQLLKKLNNRDLMLTQLSSIEEMANRMRRLQLESLAQWEKIKPAYLHPHNMRNMSFLIKYLDELDETLDEMKNKIGSGALTELPETLITGTQVEL